jgi:hypothetical protein
MKHAIATLKVNHLSGEDRQKRKAPSPEGDGAHNQVWL